MSVTGHSAPSPLKPRIAATMGKASILKEALPYIRSYRNRTVVIKYGGSAMSDPGLRSSFGEDVALLHLVGIDPVVVHGGGPQISEAMERAGIEPRFVEGLRVTDSETLRVVQQVLVGEVNPEVVRAISAHGAGAAGLTGLDGNLLLARARDERLGLVGEVVSVDPEVVRSLQEDGFVPVVAPIARGEDGRVYNVNADTAAGALAAALGAEKLVYLTDVEGLYRDLADTDSLLSKVSLGELRKLVGSASRGMVPKLASCIAALEAGVRRAHILDGRMQHALLLEIFTPEGIGTMVVHDDDRGSG